MNGRVPAAREGVLLVGHGSRSAASDAEMEALTALVAGALPTIDVRLGYLEMSEPPAGPVIDDMVASGCRRVVVLPLVLLAGGHGKSDVPAICLEARQRHPDAEFVLANPLGITHDLVSLLGGRLLAAGGRGLPLLLVARGTSDPDANGDAHKAARLLAEWTGAPFVHTAFTGVTIPTVPEALEVFPALGHRRLATAFWFLADGVLVERARRQMSEFSSRRGVEVLDAGYLGPDPRVVATVLRRYREALDGVTHVNCDTCAYRAAWPGLEGRVGEAVGVGHSHLAAEHRHHGYHGH